MDTTFLGLLIGVMVPITSLLMGFFKKQVKFEVKKWYLLPGALISAGAAAALFPITGVAFELNTFLFASVFIFGDELLLQNELWPQVAKLYSKFRDDIKKFLQGVK